MRLVLASSLLLLAIAPSVASADGVAITQHDLTATGDPLLVANYVPDGRLATPTWKRCAPDCGETVATGQGYDAGDTAAGTAFEATTVFEGTTTTARSRTWTGKVTNLTLPTISGDARVGGTVTGTAGTWTGGWGDERSQLRLRLCKSPEPGTPCVSLPETSATVIDRAYAGWYVGTIETRYAREAVFPAGIYPAPVPGVPSGVPAPAPARTVVWSGLLGPIAPGPSDSGDDLKPPKEPPTLGFTPKVTVLKKAKKGKARKLGTVSCAGTCLTVVTYAQGKKSVTTKLTISGSKSLVLPATLSIKKSTRVAVSFLASPVVKSATVKPVG